MCGILCAFNSKLKVKKSTFKLIESRGSDNYGLFNGDSILHYDSISKLPESIDSDFMFQNLLSINSFTPQPITNERFVFVTNCEIYNYKDLAKSIKFKSKFDSNSDSLFLFNYLTDGLEDFSKSNYDPNMIEKHLESNISNLKSKLKSLDGVFVFVLYDKINNFVYFGKDVLGVKQLSYIWGEDSDEKKLLILGTERKLLNSIINSELKSNSSNFKIRNLDGNSIVAVDLDNNSFIESSYDDQTLNLPESYFSNKADILDRLQTHIEDAILKRVQTDKKIGVLFSGGIDSTLICAILLKHKIPFTCYSSYYFDENIRLSPDHLESQTIAKLMNMDFKTEKITLNLLDKNIKTIIDTIEDVDTVKLGVAIPFYFASRLANKDDVKILFSGIGSEECFAGYQRHLKVLDANKDVNAECLNGFKEIQFRDLYRDDLITMKNNVELRLPFLDKALVNFSLSIDPKLKINSEQKKIILREVAKRYDIPIQTIERKKLGAQYGSNFDKAIMHLAKKYGFKFKKEIINYFQNDN